ncbi:MAG: GNAT family N-acetyltransferase [Paracoccaceae bacterium]
MKRLFDTLEATWPAAALHRAGPWLIREGRGGGQRVSAATAEADWAEADIPLAETAQAALGQPPLFLVRDGEKRLDAALAARGYRVHDPVFLRAAPVGAVAVPVPPLSAFPHWPPLAIAREIWEDGGIGPARLAVMDRAGGGKTAILARTGDRVSGVAFLALHGDEAMLHALHVTRAFRRQGSAVNIMRAAADWAQDHGAERISVAVTQANTAANGLYASLPMPIVGEYRYRVK